MAQTHYSRLLASEYQQYFADGEPKLIEDIQKLSGNGYQATVKQLNRLVEMGFITKDPRRTGGKVTFRKRFDGATPVVMWGQRGVPVDDFFKVAMQKPTLSLANSINNMPLRMARYLYQCMVAVAQSESIEEYSGRGEMRKELNDTLARIETFTQTVKMFLNHPHLWNEEAIEKWGRNISSDEISKIKLKEFENYMKEKMK